jgi:hypothetical protein
MRPRRYGPRRRPDFFAILSNDEFLRKFRFSKAGVLWLVSELYGDREAAALPLNRLTLSSAERVLVGLRFLGRHAVQDDVADIFKISQKTVHNISWDFVTRVVELKKAEWCSWPQGQRLEEAKAYFSTHYGLPGVAGALDCTHLLLSVSFPDQRAFRDRRGHTSLQVQAACDHNFEFTHLNVEWPGSVHDSRILAESQISQGFDSGLNNFLLLGDGGYGNGKAWLLTPFPDPSTASQRRFNGAQKRGRVLIEQSFGQAKRRFRCLGGSLRCRTIYGCQKMALCSLLLHNAAKRQLIPLPAGEEDEDEEEQEEADAEGEAAEQRRLPGVAGDGRGFRDQYVRTHFT